MFQVCFLVAVFILASVIGRALLEKTNAESSEGENVKYQRRQAAANFTCGLRPGIRSKRDDNSADSDLLDKIIGGSSVNRGEVPWQVNLVERGSHVCGGSILNEYWVLTTADCVNAVRENASLLTVIAGDHDLTATDPDEVTYQTAKVIVRDAFVPPSFDYNIALLKITGQNGRGFRWGNNVQPVCLPTAEEILQRDDLLTISGWGIQAVWETSPPAVLKKSSVKIGDYFMCNLIHSGITITERMACAWDNGEISNVCFGDHGGPATFQSGGRTVLAAIISGGNYCGLPSHPVVLTRVSAFLDFITSGIAESSNGTQGLMPTRPATVT